MSSMRSVTSRRPPGAEPCRPKPEGCWTVSTVTAPKGSLAHTPHSSQRADSPRVYFATMVLLYHRPCHITAKSGTSAQATAPGQGGWKQPCLRPRLGIPPCRSSGGGWKTQLKTRW